MAEFTRGTMEAMQDGLMATAAAIRSFREGLHAMEHMPEAKRVRPHLRLAHRRLAAIERDLWSRLEAQGTQDTLFVALVVAQGGLASLADAVLEMRAALHTIQRPATTTEGRPSAGEPAIPWDEGLGGSMEWGRSPPEAGDGLKGIAGPKPWTPASGPGTSQDEPRR